MPRTAPFWPSSGTPIAAIPPRKVVEYLQIYRQGRHIPEVSRAIEMIEHPAAEVERLGGEVVKADLFDTKPPHLCAGREDSEHQQPHNAAGGERE